MNSNTVCSLLNFSSSVRNTLETEGRKSHLALAFDWIYCDIYGRLPNLESELDPCQFADTSAQSTKPVAKQNGSLPNPQIVLC